MIPTIIIFVLLLLNAFFVAAEFAIVGAPRSAIDARAARNDRLAKLVQARPRRPRRQDLYIATAQIGITVASLGLGMYGEHVVADWLLEDDRRTRPGPIGWRRTASRACVAIAILTYFHIVIGEMLPKSMALQARRADCRSG